MKTFNEFEREVRKNIYHEEFKEWTMGVATAILLIIERMKEIEAHVNNTGDKGEK